jgi:hypothetical protein
MFQVWLKPSGEILWQPSVAPNIFLSYYNRELDRSCFYEKNRRAEAMGRNCHCTKYSPVDD